MQATMSSSKLQQLQHIFVSRLDTLSHILQVGQTHLADRDLINERLAPDMLPLGAQVAFACNQPRGFSQWCAGQPIENIDPAAVASLEDAHALIADTRARVLAIACDDAQLDEIKRIGMGKGRYCELPGDQYASEYLLPNLYFHITAAYAILRMLGAPVGKADYMRYLAAHIRQDS
ncbi:MAG: DUF1993 domain-containing protein [Thermomonas sp.]